MPEATLAAIGLCAEGLGVELRKKRLEWTKSLLQLVLDTGNLSNSFHWRDRSTCGLSSKNKKFGVMHAALEAVGYEDAGVALEASVGFPLVGWMRRCGIFSAHVRPPELRLRP